MIAGRLAKYECKYVIFLYCSFEQQLSCTKYQGTSKTIYLIDVLSVISICFVNTLLWTFPGNIVLGELFFNLVFALGLFPYS